MADGNERYQGSLWLQSESKPYKREVKKVLDLITSTHAGQTLIKHIAKHRLWMVIVPYDPKKEEDAVNAYAAAEEYGASLKKDYIDWMTKEIQGHDYKFLRAIGTGEGSHVRVRFHPAIYRELIKRKGYIAPGDGPGEVLFHEMTHGYRMQFGLGTWEPVPGYAGYDDVEEFYAILAANVYRANRGFRYLRKDHDGHERMEAHLATSTSFYEEFQDLIDAWFNEQREFCLDMAGVGAWFNPFRIAAITLGLLDASIVPMTLYE